MRLTTVTLLLSLPLAGRAYGYGFEIESDGPLPGRDKVVAGKPDWCKGLKVEPLTDEYRIKEELRALERTLKSTGFSDENLGEMARLACAAPDAANVQASIAMWRQTYINQKAVTDKEDRAHLKLRADAARWEKQKQEFCDAHQNPGEEANDFQVTDWVVNATYGECGYASGDSFWALDRAPELPAEIHRVFIVDRCVGGDPSQPRAMAAYAQCPDVRRLDRAKLDKDLADASLNDYARVKFLEAFARVKAAADEATAFYQKHKDADVKKVLLDAPEAGWTAWESAYATWKNEIDAARAIEDKVLQPSKKAAAGCAAELEPHWEKWVRSIKPASYDDAVKKLREDMVGFTLAATLRGCYQQTDNNPSRAVLEYLITGARQHRGPRTEAAHYALAALSEVLADREKFPMDPRHFSSGDGYPNHFEWKNNPYYLEQQEDTLVAGEVTEAKALKDASGVQATFKKDRWMDEVMDCVDSNRIHSISPNGTVTYYQDCKPGGTVERVEGAEPVMVDKEHHGDVLKKGQFGRFLAEMLPPPDTTRRGYILELWDSPKKKKLVAVMGVPL